MVLRGSNIVGIHQNLLQALVSLPNILTVILVESTQCLDLVVQVPSQRLREGLNETLDFLTIVSLHWTSLRVRLKLLESRRERSVLLDIAAHEPLNT